VWNGDLPRPLQQILFDTADGATRQRRHPYPALADHKPAAGSARPTVKSPHLLLKEVYGEHPETALIRMRWALTAVASAFGSSRAEPAHAPRTWPLHHALHLPCRMSHRRPPWIRAKGT
jgi:hypothetical protein